jgi:tripartite-type tricarboxylate transporter receptor subunit TctC
VARNQRVKRTAHDIDARGATAYIRCFMKTSSIVTLLLTVLGASATQAQPYPARPIRLIVPFPAGGTIDMVGRMVAQGVGDRLGQTIVVDNRGGAGGMLGVDLVAKAAPDGYTLCLCSAGAMISSPLLSANPPYDARRDFAPVSRVATAPYLLLVRNAPGLSNIADLVALAKQKPGALNYGSAGAGSTSHLAAALFVSMAGVNVVHVPYKGSAPAATDLFGGQIQFVFEAIGAGTQYVKTGRLRALGVSTLKRSITLPELPTISEQGIPGYEMSTWHTVCAPRGTPPAIIDKLNREIVAVIQAPETRERFAAAGTEPQSSTPEQLRLHIAQEFPRWEKLLAQLGLREK